MMKCRRTNIELDDDLLAQAARYSTARTKRRLIHEALATYSPSMKRSGAVRLLVPWLHYWEFANALRTLAARKAIEEGAAQELLDLHQEAPLEVAEPDRREVFRLALANDVQPVNA